MWLSGSPRNKRVSLCQTTEAEYVEITEVVKESLWFTAWIKEVLGTQVQPLIRCDNEAGIKLVKGDSDS